MHTAGGDELGLRRAGRRARRAPRPAFEHAITFRGPLDAEAMHGLVQDVEGGWTRSVAFVVPAGRRPGRLPLYELALLTAERAHELCLDARAPRRHAEDAPLEVFGTQASRAGRRCSTSAGIQLLSGASPARPAHGVARLRPGGERTEVDRDRRAPAPGRAARRRACRPTRHGFLPVDEHGRVRGIGDVYAAGDGTDFPLKQGGLATQQADVAVRAIAAARRRARRSREPFRPYCAAS